MSSGKRKRNKTSRFLTPEHYESTEVKARVSECINFIDAARQKALPEDQRKEFRNTLSKIINWTPFVDDKKMDEVLAAVSKVDKGELLSAGDLVVLKTAAAFVPDLSMSADEEDCWMEEEAARRAGPPVPRLTSLVLTNDPLEAGLRASIAQIGDRAGETAGILSELQEFANRHNQPIQIHPQPIMFTDEKSKKNTWSGRAFAPFSTLPQFLNAGAHLRDRQISVALVIVWSVNPTARTFEEWSAEDLHALLFVQVHPLCGATRGQVPKALLICDVNCLTKTGAPELLPRTRKLLKVSGVLRTQYINFPRAERNTRGICLTLALEWILELVVQGLQIKRDGRGCVTEVEGFRQLV
ncbi:hypothetical protein B0H17DRAFT_1076802 [Mycena rosella]|uniref:Uncharacterized protein n=1 Tax=Mycena rosella TaxID=1033263 RepID=A0AAD7GC02_MYCRO|nr:hypothetical protein B0H17DRAFT_1076802 [Mycena rosella]